MVYRVLYDSKNISLTAVCAIVLLLLSCVPTEELQQQPASTPVQQQPVVRNANTTQGSEENSASESRSGESITVTYRNQSSNIQLNLDPNKDQFYLDLSGMAPTDKDTAFVVDSTLIKNRAADIQALLAGYRKAQDLFYLGEYRDALDEINKTLEIQETADGYALKGTIFFMLDNPTAARANWYRAVQMNPDIPVPSIPELENLIDDIREDDN